ncbi:IS110 family transposase [Rhizobium leguminosarum]|uniref:IS110 family transposase n=1 Tax=Rhizobium leguminosarum TaxID=384 RepID=UPI0015FC2005|nr:IS110 family transposase [Rhizobium leguminosarum]MBA9031749.1 transposase [Rhizobium leguminosarum]
MNKVVTIGLDLAKQVFQVHGVDAEGKTLFNRTLRRTELLPFFEKMPTCLIGMEACSSAYHWARQFVSLGHNVKLMPAVYVKAFVKRGKTDAIDAEAICDAVMHKNMRFVPVKTVEQQAFTMLLKVRALFVRQRTKTINALRSHMAEFGIVVPTGVTRISALLDILNDENDNRIPEVARAALSGLSEEVELLAARIEKLDEKMASEVKHDKEAQRLMTIPGVGKTTAGAIKAHVVDASAFKSSRDFSAWIGLTPKASGSGGKIRNGRISRAGNPVLRSLLYMGATSVLRENGKSESASPWLKKLMARRPFKVVAIAVANKMARIIWALLRNGGTYHAPFEPNPATA